MKNIALFLISVLCIDLVNKALAEDDSSSSNLVHGHTRLKSDIALLQKK